MSFSCSGGLTFWQNPRGWVRLSFVHDKNWKLCCAKIYPLIHQIYWQVVGLHIFMASLSKKKFHKNLHLKKVLRWSSSFFSKEKREIIWPIFFCSWWDMYLQSPNIGTQGGVVRKKNVKGGRKKGIMASLIENGTKLKQGW